MAVEKTEKVWLDGELIPWDEARFNCRLKSMFPHLRKGLLK